MTFSRNKTLVQKNRIQQIISHRTFCIYLKAKKLLIFLLVRRSISNCTFSLLFFLFLSSCHSYKKNDSHLHVPDANIKNGQLLAAKYCQSCHLLPNPSLNDTRTWGNDILPLMGPRLGIFGFDNKIYPSKKNDLNLPHGFYPSQPLMNNSEWQNIIDYYTALSPTSLPTQKRSNPIRIELPIFKVETPVFQYVDPTTCYVNIDTFVTPHELWIGDILKKNIYRFNDQMELVDSLDVNGIIVDKTIQNNKIVVCDIGLINPTNDKSGKAQTIIRNSNGGIQSDSVLFDKLMRPVQITSVDLNIDGRSDYLVCEFGYLVGALSWYQNLGNNQFERHVIRETAGPIKAYVKDYNHDGLPDLWVLFAQGEEGIFLFTNKGNGRFDAEEVLRFPPSFGSSYFELVDFNNDSLPDILYTCGDNGDFKPVLKPYHGVYIFLNDKTNHFKEQYFFPIHGCYKAIARDFDGDGDLDIATISFFADYVRQPEEGFVYLENLGDLKFMPFTSPEIKAGRWLAMDAGDLDGDGKPDIILGNYSFWPGTRKPIDYKKEPSFILLRNIANKTMQPVK